MMMMMMMMKIMMIPYPIRVLLRWNQPRVI